MEKEAMRRYFVLAPLAPLAAVPPAPAQTPRLDPVDASYQSLIDSWYRRYLRRPAESYRSDAVAMLKSGTTQETLLASILTSPEYYNAAGGDDTRYVRRLITDVTGRPPAPREAARLLDRLRWEDRNEVVADYLSLHPEGLGAPQPVPEPPYEYRRNHHRDYDYDRWDPRRR